MEAFYISRQGYQEGPHSLELIADKIKSGYLTPNDYIYFALKNQWIMLSRFDRTKDLCQNLLKGKEDTEPMWPKSPENTWHLLRGDSQSGPYEFRQIVNMLLEKKAFEYDYVWTPTMKSWEKISECSYFQEEKLKPFLDPKNMVAPNQFRRSAARVELGASLVVHNHKKVWNGMGFEISAGGASIEVNENNVKKGEVLVLHYRPSKRVPAFNVHCEVVSCQKNEKNSESGSNYRLGLRFLKVNSVAQKVLREFVSKNAA